MQASKEVAVLFVNEKLEKKQKLVSECGKFFLVMQDDGNCCLYDDTGCMFQTNTWHQGSYAKLTEFGVFAVYDASNRPIWTSTAQPSPKDSSYKMIVLNDGNMVIFDKHDKPLCHTNTPKAPNVMKPKA
ncbi:hypothetical protein SELMODRAFT_438249 [Selaginella moellendorffii]|uniref:Bulb-type lectin domain-containing protein n=1 Tax=Selaginella moellendorffii TaxID=88036 RepID=D8QVB2_SELML|nr:comitin [Selaginella moellendorffii]EFJ36026.1 hypothetical protein SELMODRAFT_438249 [Selaginella moellendorffii]|eukprot:XP_002962563.1 comitin [Selaginella moellendorffii]